MRRFPISPAFGIILAIAVLSRALARDDKAGAAEQPKEPIPTVDAEGQPRAALDERGPVMALFVDNDPNLGSFCIAKKSAECHYTFSSPMVGVSGAGGASANIYVMLNENAEFVGSDKSGYYWHYRIDRKIDPDKLYRIGPLVKDWYFPKDDGRQTGIWYKTTDAGAKLVLYGKPVRYMLVHPIR